MLWNQLLILLNVTSVILHKQPWIIKFTVILMWKRVIQVKRCQMNSYHRVFGGQRFKKGVSLYSKKHLKHSTKHLKLESWRNIVREYHRWSLLVLNYEVCVSKTLRYKMTLQPRLSKHTLNKFIRLVCAHFTISHIYIYWRYRNG